MVNAILRNLERSLDRLPTIPEDDPAEYYATLYSHPVWLVRELLETLGSEGTAAFLQADNSQPPITAMVNTVKTDLEGALEALQAEGVHGEPHPWLKNCLVLSRSGSLEELDAFQNGLFYVQDPASRLAVLALDPGNIHTVVCLSIPQDKVRVHLQGCHFFSGADRLISGVQKHIRTENAASVDLGRKDSVDVVLISTHPGNMPEEWILSVLRAEAGGAEPLLSGRDRQDVTAIVC